MAQSFEHLEWDSDFFGFGVARITQTDLNATELSETLRILREKNYRLAYWQFPAANEESNQFALAQGGFFADEKLTYVKELPEEPISLPGSSYTPYAYPGSTANPSIIRLALQSSENSRFRVDPQFPGELCDRLYTCWVSRSISKELAWEVLVVAEAGDYLGLITLGASNGRGDIGLLAVTEQARGKGIGKALVAAAENRFIQNHDSVVQVVTQKHNLGACHLYETCGFKIDTIYSIFHFWI
jgi:dTDP-4-amino-4,6-dideoxy-D-galactose acyltransferase